PRTTAGRMRAQREGDAALATAAMSAEQGNDAARDDRVEDEAGRLDRRGLQLRQIDDCELVRRFLRLTHDHGDRRGETVDPRRLHAAPDGGPDRGFSLFRVVP